MCIYSTRTVTCCTESHLIFSSLCCCCGCTDSKPAWLPPAPHWAVWAALWTIIRTTQVIPMVSFLLGLFQMRKVSVLEQKGKCKVNMIFCLIVRKSSIRMAIASGLGSSDDSHYAIAFGIKCMYRSKHQTVPFPWECFSHKDTTLCPFFQGFFLVPWIFHSFLRSHLVSTRGESIFHSALPINWQTGYSLRESEMCI